MEDNDAGSDMCHFGNVGKLEVGKVLVVLLTRGSLLRYFSLPLNIEMLKIGVNFFHFRSVKLVCAVNLGINANISIFNVIAQMLKRC